MANFLDYLNGWEPKKEKETIEDVGAKDLLNRILAELISLHETLEDLSDTVNEMKEKANQNNLIPQTNNVQPLQTDFNVSVPNPEGVKDNIKENFSSAIRVANMSESEFSDHMADLLG